MGWCTEHLAHCKMMTANIIVWFEIMYSHANLYYLHCLRNEIMTRLRSSVWNCIPYIVYFHFYQGLNYNSENKEKYSYRFMSENRQWFKSVIINIILKFFYTARRILLKSILRLKIFCCPVNCLVGLTFEHRIWVD